MQTDTVYPSNTFLGDDKDDSPIMRQMASIVTPIPAEQLVSHTPTSSTDSTSDNRVTVVRDLNGRPAGSPGSSLSGPQPIVRARPGIGGVIAAGMNDVPNQPSQGTNSVSLPNGVNIGSSLPLSPQGAFSWMTGQDAATDSPTLSDTSSQPTMSDASPSPAMTRADGSQVLRPAGQPQLQPAGGGGSGGGFWSKLGNAAGNILVPGAMRQIPGTDANNRLRANIALERAQKQAVLEDTQSQTEQRAAQGRRADAQVQGLLPMVVTPEMHAQNPDLVVGTTFIPHDYAATVRESTKGRLRNQGIQQRDIDEAPSKGMKVIDDPDHPGQKKIVDDPDSAVARSRDALNAYRGSMAKIAGMKADMDREKITPGTPAWNQKQQQIAAEGERANAYMGRYLLAAKGQDLQGNDLPGQTTVTNDEGQTTGVGTAFQNPAARQQAQVAQFNDVGRALDDLESKAKILDKKGGKLNDPAIAAAIADPEHTATQWAQGLVKSGLSPEQRDYVISKKAFDENLQALRKAAGGTATESSVNRLIQMAPGASTPDLDYLLRQTGQVRAQAKTLGKGITGIRGGQTVGGLRPAGGGSLAGPINA